MLYRQTAELLIRDLMPEDAQIITDEEIAQGWHQSADKYLMRLEHQKCGRCIALAAEYRGHVAGYINVYRKPCGGPWYNQGVPEIVDFGVLEKYRRKGIGTALMDEAEKIAGQWADVVYLGVGLHTGYGSAQRMYAKRGYIPDGSGVWYGNQICTPYAPCINDDDLVLYLSKRLR